MLTLTVTNILSTTPQSHSIKFSKMNPFGNAFSTESVFHRPGETQPCSSSTSWTQSDASGQPVNISGAFMSFSPLAKTVPVRDTNATSYPSQQLNHLSGLNFVYPDPEAIPVEKFPSPPSTFANPPPLLPPAPVPVAVVSCGNNFVPQGVSSNPSFVDLKKADQDNNIKGESSNENVNILDSFTIELSPPDRSGRATMGSESSTVIRVKNKSRTSATNPRALPLKKTENNGEERSGIETPGKFDILRGRGGLTNHHPGNIKFRGEARALRGKYKSFGTTRKQKYLYSIELVNKVKAYGAKFLEKGADDLWYEMEEKDARKKASQGTCHLSDDIIDNFGDLLLVHSAFLFNPFHQCYGRRSGTSA